MIRDLKLALDLLERGHTLIALHLPARYYPCLRDGLTHIIQALRAHIARLVKPQPTPP